jgi:hypothetical protein
LITNIKIFTFEKESSAIDNKKEIGKWEQYYAMTAEQHLNGVKCIAMLFVIGHIITLATRLHHEQSLMV